MLAGGRAFRGLKNGKVEPAPWWGYILVGALFVPMVVSGLVMLAGITIRVTQFVGPGAVMAVVAAAAFIALGVTRENT